MSVSYNKPLDLHWGTPAEFAFTTPTYARVDGRGYLIAGHNPKTDELWLWEGIRMFKVQRSACEAFAVKQRTQP